MFWHLYYYRLKIQLKNKVLLFWSLVFPLLLGLFFTAAFSSLDTIDLITKIPVGIVTDEQVSPQNTELFLNTLKEIKSNDQAMFSPTILSKEKADKQLLDEKIDGYYTLTNEDIALTVSKQTIQQNVLDSFMNQFLQSKMTLATLQKEDPALLASSITEKIGKTTNYISVKQATASKGSQKSFFFFTLIGMSCMFGMFWGISNANDEQANQSANGIRLSMTPKNKLFIVLTNLISSFTIFSVEIFFILGFFHFVYGVDFGTRWLLILLTCALATLTALSLGVLFGNILKVPLNQKISLAVTFQMTCSFLAGMMSPDIKLLVNQHLPWLNAINPVNLISEALYKLYYYQNIDSFYTNLLSLLILTVIFIIASVIYERRVQYVSL
ncbi:ABC transporter permease [Enterococcus crotali]|uniref:ABC transporter permease n=1 Tax=Enterococcus crotali TaxID=1453587 RepID=UPI00046F35BB|nr:ABC transporter permease [Enterococcus crotali]